MFAVLMALSNLAGVLSHESGALLMHWMGITETDFQRLWLLVLVTNLSTLLPLPLLHWLPSNDATDVSEPIALEPQVDEVLVPPLVTESSASS